MITIDEITIIRNERELIYDYSEQIPAGSITAIVGPNGCGKSTLLGAIAGDFAPNKGTITIDEIHPILAPTKMLAKLRAVAVQNQVFTLGFTVRQVIEMGGYAEDLMVELGLIEFANQKVTTLSGGQAQRVAVAQAIAQRTPVLLLDEPFASQDIASKDRIIHKLKALAQIGTSIVVVTHESETNLSWVDKTIKDFL